MPYVKWILNLCTTCVTGRQKHYEPLTQCPLQVKKNYNASWPWSQCKTMTCYPVWFSSKRKSSVPQDIIQESPFTDGNHEAVKTELCNLAAWFQLKHWISKTITPILMRNFYVFPVYFDGKFVGGALANWYGKLAPVVDQCFESQKHWIFAFFSSEKEPGFIQKNNSRLELMCRIVWNNLVVSFSGSWRSIICHLSQPRTNYLTINLPQDTWIANEFKNI